MLTFTHVLYNYSSTVKTKLDNENCILVIAKTRLIDAELLKEILDAIQITSNYATNHPTKKKKVQDWPKIAQNRQNFGQKPCMSPEISIRLENNDLRTHDRNRPRESFAGLYDQIVPFVFPFPGRTK